MERVIDCASTIADAAGVVGADDATSGGGRFRYTKQVLSDDTAALDPMGS